MPQGEISFPTISEFTEALPGTQREILCAMVPGCEWRQPTQVIPSHLTVHANFGIMESVEPVGGFSQAIAKYVFNIKKKRDLYINHIL